MTPTSTTTDYSASGSTPNTGRVVPMKYVVETYIYDWKPVAVQLRKVVDDTEFSDFGSYQVVLYYPAEVIVEEFRWHSRRPETVSRALEHAEKVCEEFNERVAVAWDESSAID
jgi:hypothetical protein